MIHDWACIQPLRTVLLWGIGTLKVESNAGGQTWVRSKEMPGVGFAMCSRKVVPQCPNR
jgi:hypothetical protein